MGKDNEIKLEITQENKQCRIFFQKSSRQSTRSVSSCNSRKSNEFKENLQKENARMHQKLQKMQLLVLRNQKNIQGGIPQVKKISYIFLLEITYKFLFSCFNAGIIFPSPKCFYISIILLHLSSVKNLYKITINNFRFHIYNITFIHTYFYNYCTCGNLKYQL
ncbi:unnamed protein product [Paramecium sonneborni]|uniref:Uncharacterized protein n=1 Tax=Paramecium sonneborni TaxID=65129 RepID=A0A8S1MIB2_9CILI|nr:unnamed protein product [Paramecium sonneborni]